MDGEAKLKQILNPLIPLILVNGTSHWCSLHQHILYHSKDLSLKKKFSADASQGCVIRKEEVPKKLQINSRSGYKILPFLG